MPVAYQAISARKFERYTTQLSIQLFSLRKPLLGRSKQITAATAVGKIARAALIVIWII
jgi:hypothetical protein